MPDIDIDFLDRDTALKLFKHTVASRVDNAKLVKHNSGVYLHDVPVDAVSNLCAVPYEQAEEQSFFKIDFLNVGIYISHPSASLGDRTAAGAADLGSGQRACQCGVVGGCPH